MPKIKNFIIDFDDHVSFNQSILSKLLNNDKIVKLLNVQQSVNCLQVHLLPDVFEVIQHKSDIANLCGLTISKFDNLEKGVWLLNSDYPMFSQQRKELFGLIKELLLQMLVKPTTKYTYLKMTQSDTIYEKKFIYTIKIENKNQLPYCKRDTLKSKISSKVDQSIKDVKDTWHKFRDIRIEQCFKFEREYSI